MKFKPIIIVAGEPRSIFFEIFFKSLKAERYKSPIILIASKKDFFHQKKKYKFNKMINLINLSDKRLLKYSKTKINLINVPLNDYSKYKKISKKSKNYIEKCFEIALDLINKKISNKLINGPISKKYFLNKKFLGITEYLAKKTKTKKYAMLIYNEKLSVSPITTHLPLKLVTKKLNKNIIKEKIMLIQKFYKIQFNFNPKIAVTCINPHCESVENVNEDDKVVLPIVKKLKKNKLKIFGPLSADTIFLKQNRKNFDVILGMYHDQVLTPFKTLFEYDAINITLGLPFIRISPDHGPNEKMFGKNRSNPQSLIKALKFLDY